MTTDLEKSFKAKLRAIAKEKNRDPADLWQTLTLERFLVRLANSKYRDQFVLKGGILLSKYLEIGRETTDLDFLAKKISNQVSSLQVIFEEIAAIDLNDGFIFKEAKASELTHHHMGYPGVEISMMAYFGSTRLVLEIWLMLLHLKLGLQTIQKVIFLKIALSWLAIQKNSSLLQS